MKPALAVAAAVACLPAAPLPGPGTPAPFRAPEPRAVELNASAKTLYRQGKWEEARAQYRAASAADPSFLAPRLNVACSFVRQERFREATAEVQALLAEAYVPWAREVLEAADLGALKVRPEGKEIERAMRAAAQRWGEGLGEALLFVARARPALRVPSEGAGVFILNPHQEVWAFAPSTGRYRQLTAEDGHVVALARAPDGRRIVYVTAEKLVRGARADDVTLRGVAVHALALADMTSAPPLRLDGDVRRLEIRAAPNAGDLLLSVDRNGQRAAYVLARNGAIEPLDGLTDIAPRRASLVVLTGRGVAPAAGRARAGVAFGGEGCALAAQDTRTVDGTPAIAVSGAGRRAGKPQLLDAGAGAAIAGLPIP